MTAMNIEHLVKDWGGFETFVAQLHQTGDVTVEHDVTITGRSGAPRQIDVLIRHKLCAQHVAPNFDQPAPPRRATHD
jgi:hypothetical protein